MVSLCRKQAMTSKAAGQFSCAPQHEEKLAPSLWRHWLSEPHALSYSRSCPVLLLSLCFSLHQAGSEKADGQLLYSSLFLAAGSKTVYVLLHMICQAVLKKKFQLSPNIKAHDKSTSAGDWPAAQWTTYLTCHVISQCENRLCLAVPDRHPRRCSERVDDAL